MSQLTIIERKAWNPDARGGPVQRRPFDSLTELFIHWPGAVPDTWSHLTTDMREHMAIHGIQRFHIQSNGWSDIGYNYVMVPNYGRRSRVPNIYEARGGQYLPAAQLHHNTDTLAICVLMGPNDHLSDDVKARLRSFVRWARRKTGNDLHVRGHREVTGTECPGPKLTAYLPELRRVR